MNRSKAHEFIVRCIAEMESDGYQTWEEDTENGVEVPDGITPDHWGHNDKDEITIVFGGETFKVKVTKARKA